MAAVGRTALDVKEEEEEEEKKKKKKKKIAVRVSMMNDRKYGKRMTSGHS